VKDNLARTVPLVIHLVSIVGRRSEGKAPDAWLFAAPEGDPLRESNWKRSIGWAAATAAIGHNSGAIPGSEPAMIPEPFLQSSSALRRDAKLCVF